MDFSERLLEKCDSFVYNRQSATESPVDIFAIALKLLIEGSLRSFGLEF